MGRLTRGLEWIGAQVVRLWQGLSRTAEREARGRLLYAEAERGRARPIRGMEAPDEYVMARQNLDWLREDAEVVRAWKARRAAWDAERREIR